MTLAADIAAKILELHPIHEEVRVLHEKWIDLQTVDEAQADVAHATLAEDRTLEQLKGCKAELESEKNRLTLTREVISPVGAALRDRTALLNIPTQRFQRRSVVARPREPSREVEVALRRAVQKMVNRWAYTWRLKPGTQSQINSIANNADRHLGEALELLDWEIFEDRIRTRESETDHLARLVAWGRTLTEYRDTLKMQIESKEIQYGAVLADWRLWKRRKTDAAAQSEWETEIAERRRAKQADIERLRAEIEPLEQEVAGLRARSCSGGMKL
jgi:hypothetical protein